MTNTTVKDLLAEITALEDRLSKELPRRRGQVEEELRDLRDKRRPLFIAFHVNNDGGAGDEVAEIDARVAELNDKVEALALVEHQAQAELEGKLLDRDALEDAYNWEVAKNLREQMDTIIAEVERDLFTMSIRLVELQGLSSQQQKLLGPEEGAEANFHRVKLYLSPKIVLCLGRVGKMNLNSSISSGTHAWYAGEKAAHDKEESRQGALREKEQN